MHRSSPCGPTLRSHAPLSAALPAARRPRALPIAPLVWRQSASSFNQPLDWDVSSATTFYRMFRVSRPAPPPSPFSPPPPPPPGEPPAVPQPPPELKSCVAYTAVGFSGPVHRNRPCADEHHLGARRLPQGRRRSELGQQRRNAWRAPARRRKEIVPATRVRTESECRC